MNTVVDSLNGGWNYIESPFKHFSGLNIEVFYAHLLTNISLVFMHKYLLTSISLVFMHKYLLTSISLEKW